MPTEWEILGAGLGLLGLAATLYFGWKQLRSRSRVDPEATAPEVNGMEPFRSGTQILHQGKVTLPFVSDRRKQRHFRITAKKGDVISGLIMKVKGRRVDRFDFHILDEKGYAGFLSHGSYKAVKSARSQESNHVYAKLSHDGIWYAVICSDYSFVGRIPPPSWPMNKPWTEAPKIEKVQVEVELRLHRKGR